MHRLVEDRLEGAFLHDPSRVHDRDLIAGLRHNAQIMGDHDDGCALTADQILHQIQHLRLDGHVQGGRRLVREQQLRVARECDGDDHTLLHAAGELMRVLHRPICGDADQLQHLLRPLVSFLAGQILFMKVYALRDLLAHRINGIQAGHGVLKNHGHVLAAHLLQLR